MKFGKIKQCPNSRTDICIRVSRWRRIVDSLLNCLTLHRKLLRTRRAACTGTWIRRRRVPTLRQLTTNARYHMDLVPLDMSRTDISMSAYLLT